MTRITPITDRSQLPAERQHEWDHVMSTWGRVRGPFAVLLQSAGLAPAFIDAVKQTHADHVVSDALHELVILAVAREYGAPYQWSAHIARARDAGLSEEAIEAARNAGDTSGLDEDERDVIEYVRQLCRTHRAEQSLFDALRDRHGERWLVLLTATIGQYQYVATFNNAFEIDPLPGDDQLPTGRSGPLA